MTIFLSFLQGKPGHPIPAYGFWEYYIKQGIEEAGHEWCECPEVDWAYGLVAGNTTAFAAWKADAWERTIRFLKANPADLFLSYFYPLHVDGIAIAEIRKMGIPCVNFFCDNVRTFRKIPKEYAGFDLHWVPEHNAMRLYQEAGMPAINLPMPMWVSPEHRVPKPEKLGQITFVGSPDIQRILLFDEILEKAPRLPLAIHGAGWTPERQTEAPGAIARQPYGLREKAAFQLDFIRSQGFKAWWRKSLQSKETITPSARLQQHLRGKPDFDDYIRLSQESRITIGVNRYPSFRFPLHRPDSYSRLRDIEAPMLGCCYLTERTAGLDKMYDIGEDILVYDSPDEFIAQCDRLTSEEKLRKKIRINGQQRSLNNLSIPNTLDSIFKTL
jgi:hypothetical protein